MARQDRYESPEMAAFFQRMARAMVKRAATGDLEALSALADSRAALDEAIVHAARALHDFDYSWTQIGAELGITRQAARQMFTPPKGSDDD